MKYLFLAILAMSFSCNSRNVKQNVNRVDDTDIEKYTLNLNSDHLLHKFIQKCVSAFKVLLGVFPSRNEMEFQVEYQH